MWWPEQAFSHSSHITVLPHGGLSVLACSCTFYVPALLIDGRDPIACIPVTSHDHQVVAWAHMLVHLLCPGVTLW